MKILHQDEFHDSEYRQYIALVLTISKISLPSKIHLSYQPSLSVPYHPTIPFYRMKINLYAHALPDHKRESMEKMRSFYGSTFDTK